MPNGRAGIHVNAAHKGRVRDHDRHIARFEGCGQLVELYAAGNFEPEDQATARGDPLHLLGHGLAQGVEAVAVALIEFDIELFHVHIVITPVQKLKERDFDDQRRAQHRDVFGLGEGGGGALVATRQTRSRLCCEPRVVTMSSALAGMPLRSRRSAIFLRNGAKPWTSG